ncbi:MAG TPA: hypothetical protein IGR64_17205 [Leptolyngbyaceae cyanobacterium M65_K2018_010]|nr:hypothetical protein [Leptolyngbyaceae cyanobacterium M65_K2018_010]
MDRTQLFDALSNLPPAAFERLLIAVQMPRMNRAGAAAKIGEQVSALLEWAESPLGPGVETIERHLAELNHVEFDAYLRSLIATYEKWWDIYPLTEVISAQHATFMLEQIAQTEEQGREDPTKKETVLLPQLLQGIIDYAESEPVLLVGSPGMGKSTTLLRLLAVLAKQELQKPTPRIPVLVRLKDYQSSLSSPEDLSGMWSIIDIQNCCKFYNYEIWQEAEAVQNSKLEIQKSKQGDASGQAINQFPNATEVKIFERVEHYHEHPPGSNP